MRRWWANRSTAGRTVLVLSTLLLFFAVCGGLDASLDVPVSQEEAISTALPVVDFEPVDVGARMIRQGFTNRPVWAIALSIPGSGDEEFERVALVEVDGRTGDILNVRLDDELS